MNSKASFDADDLGDGLLKRWGFLPHQKPIRIEVARNVNFDNLRFVHYIYQCDELIKKMEERSMEMAI